MVRPRLLTLFWLFVVAAVGLASKFYRGPAESWINDSLGGLFYVIIWCLVAFFLVPRARSFMIASGVFIATCALEFLQLWHPAWLESVRATFPGAAMLGTTFVWLDIPYYVVGCVMGWAAIVRLRRTASVLS